MRNQPKPLDHIEAMRQRHVGERLNKFYGTDKIVTVVYSKRDGNVSQSTGTVDFFNGTPGMDTGSVTIKTEDKGPRTINLHRIIEIR